MGAAQAPSESEEWQEAWCGPQSTWAASCSEELGRKNWRLPTGSDASLPVSTLPLSPAF